MINNFSYTKNILYYVIAIQFVVLDLVIHELMECYFFHMTCCKIVADGVSVVLMIICLYVIYISPALEGKILPHSEIKGSEFVFYLGVLLILGLNLMVNKAFTGEFWPVYLEFRTKYKEIAVQTWVINLIHKMILAFIMTMCIIYLQSAFEISRRIHNLPFGGIISSFIFGCLHCCFRVSPYVIKIYLGTFIVGLFYMLMKKEAFKTYCMMLILLMV